MIVNQCPHPYGFDLETLRNMEGIIRQQAVCVVCGEVRPPEDAVLEAGQ